MKLLLSPKKRNGCISLRDAQFYLLRLQIHLHLTFALRNSQLEIEKEKTRPKKMDSFLSDRLRSNK